MRNDSRVCILTVDPGPVAAAGSLTVGHGQTVVVTGLVDGLGL